MEQLLAQLSPEQLASLESTAKAMLAAAPAEPAGPAPTIVVGFVTNVSAHPTDEHLQVCKVTCGGRPLQIVCGAPNCANRIKVAVALIGATLPGGVVIAERKVAGVTSQGMMCSDAELGIGDDASGIKILPELAPPGQSLDDFLAGKKFARARKPQKQQKQQSKKKKKTKTYTADATTPAAASAAANAALDAAAPSLPAASGGGAAATKTATESTLSVEEKFALCRGIAEECIKDEELLALLTAGAEKGFRPVCYDGFEPSGRMHIAQGLLKAQNVNKLTRGGCSFKFWVADWFAQMNNKLGGDLKKIRKVGEYMIEVWKASGMDMEHVTFLNCSQEINRRSDEYWTMVMEIARLNSVKRIKRCCTIMGRKEGAELSGAQIMYPCMQAADIFFLGAHICQLGLDQRKVNMLAREYADRKGLRPPVILSHHMLMGLGQGEEKMSKSNPDSAIFMEDEAHVVKRKIKKVSTVLYQEFHTANFFLILTPAASSLSLSLPPCAYDRTLYRRTARKA